MAFGSKGLPGNIPDPNIRHYIWFGHMQGKYFLHYIIYLVPKKNFFKIVKLLTRRNKFMVVECYGILNRNNCTKEFTYPRTSGLLISSWKITMDSFSVIYLRFFTKIYMIIMAVVSMSPPERTQTKFSCITLRSICKLILNPKQSYGVVCNLL